MRITNAIPISRAVAQPSAWTFTIPPIARLVGRYAGDGRGWVDPFSGRSVLAEWTNDQNPEMPARYHMEAVDFCSFLPGLFRGILFDPPYSYRQITEHYKMFGCKATSEDTSTRFYNRVKNAICDKIVPDGFALSFGWDSTGFGRNRDFELVEILLVNHGGHHHDTICTVERRTR